jgi:hypothetical protein
MNSFEFKEIIVLKNFEVGNGVLGLERDVYLSIVQSRFVNIKKSMSKYFLFFNFLFVFFVIHRH